MSKSIFFLFFPLKSIKNVLLSTGEGGKMKVNIASVFPKSSAL